MLRWVLLFLGLACATEAATAQGAKVPRIGYIMAGPKPGLFEQGFLTGLREHGYEPGRTIIIDYRAVEGEPERIPGIVAELAALDVDLIVAAAATVAIKRQTSTIPIVFTSSQDAVGDGLVESLARPGGNATGQSVHAVELTAKRLQILKDAFPGLTRVAVMWNSAALSRKSQLAEADKAGRALGLAIDSVGVVIPGGLDEALARAVQSGTGAAFFISDIGTITHRSEIGAAALRQRLPTLMSNKAYLAGGGLMSYGPDLVDVYRRSAGQVDRILKGAHPSTIPVEQPTRFELVINLKTARALDIEFPPTFLARADEVIE